MNNYRRRVVRANEIAYLCIEHGIRFENVKMIGIRIYYSKTEFMWFKCTIEDLNKAENFIIRLAFKPKDRQSSLEEF